MGLADAFSNTSPDKYPGDGSLPAGTQTGNFSGAYPYNLELSAGAVPAGTFAFAANSYVVLFRQDSDAENGVYKVDASGGASRVSGLLHPVKWRDLNGTSGQYFISTKSDGTPIFGPFGFKHTNPTPIAP